MLVPGLGQKFLQELMLIWEDILPTYLSLGPRLTDFLPNRWPALQPLCSKAIQQWESKQGAEGPQGHSGTFSQV